LCRSRHQSLDRVSSHASNAAISGSHAPRIAHRTDGIPDDERAVVIETPAEQLSTLWRDNISSAPHPEKNPIEPPPLFDVLKVHLLSRKCIIRSSSFSKCVDARYAQSEADDGQ
jgi:hypothetical protein